MPTALMVEPANGSLTASVRSFDLSALPEGDTLLETLHSSLNYKDGLAITGKGRVIRGGFPFVPGIDVVGRVLETTSDRLAQGDLVIQNGWGLGETRWGGFATHVRTRSEWLIPLPPTLTPRDAATLGTAGYTAMLAVMTLEEHHPPAGEIVVTGASGGVGSVATHLLSRLGHEVVASTGKDDAHGYLERLGASRVEPRQRLGQGAARSLESARWSGGVDSVGGATLSALIAQTATGGTIASCGNAGGIELETTVLPFILRGVTLAGIDSNTCPQPRRELAWTRLAELVSREALRAIDAGSVTLDGLAAAAESITRGEIRGRYVVSIGGDRE